MIENGQFRSIFVQKIPEFFFQLVRQIFIETEQIFEKSSLRKLRNEKMSKKMKNHFWHGFGF